MMASQKLGMLMPKSPKVVPTLSIQELGLAPAQTPSGIASSVAMLIATTASSIVAGRRLRMTLITGSVYLNDRPKSPANADRRNFRY